MIHSVYSLPVVMNGSAASCAGALVRYFAPPSQSQTF